ncbi:hypothetical protein CHARACLAT_031960, partial [Characodon lateralis]|nr:hypothetical protein [Characodon lateralis]
IANNDDNQSACTVTPLGHTPVDPMTSPPHGTMTPLKVKDSQNKENIYPGSASLSPLTVSSRSFLWCVSSSGSIT